MKIVTWNMDFWKRSAQQRKSGWNYLWEAINPDVAILQEIVPPEESFEDFSVIYHELDKKRRWGTSVISKHRISKEIHFNNYYPGSSGLIVAEIKLSDSFTLTVVSINGLIDQEGYATTTMHHILSDLTSTLHKTYGRNVILGGDFNVSEQWDKKYKNRDPMHKFVFDRLENFGLINCTKKFFNAHVQTHSHSRSTFEWQNDYIFVSENMIDKVIDCKVINESEVKDFSDHFPVIIELEL
jgi:exonuclease III